MEKIEANKKSSLKPVPKIIVSCRDKNGKDNALVVAYACNCSYAPPMIMIGIVPSRFSYHIIKETGCFAVNIASAENKEIYDYFGSVSGRDEDKFAKLKLKTTVGELVNVPLLNDCPVNIECKVTGSVITGSHEMFYATVEKVHAAKDFVGNDGNILWDKINML